MPTPKIILLTLDYPPERGGIARYLGSLVAESQGAIEVIVESHHEMNGPGTVHQRVLFRSAWPRWWPMVRVCREQRDAIILVSHVFPMGTAAWISRLMGGPPYAVLFHGLDLRRARNPWKRWLLRRITHRAERLLVNSHATGTELRRVVLGAQPIIITPGVRPLPNSIVPVPKTQPRIISISRLVSRKGLDVAIRAVASIQQETSVEYVIVGDGPDLHRLQSVAKESGARVRWISRPSDEEKLSWLASSDIFLLPVRDEGTDVEGFGIVFLEAAMAGIPSVAGRSGGAAEAVVDGETGMLVEPTNVAGVADAVRTLLNDATLRIQMGNAAKERAEKEFQWKDRWEKMRTTLLNDQCQMTNFQLSVGVVIPCFNHARELERTLQALADQTLSPSEVVVVDNGSDDDPASVVARFADRLPVRCIRFAERQGAPAARNRGAHEISSPFILFLDADTALEPSALAVMAQALEEHPEVSFAYSDFYWGWKRFYGRAWDQAALRQMNWIHTTSLIRRSDVIPFDESLKKFQDWDMWLTMAEQGKMGVWIPKPLFRVIQRSGGMSRWLPAFVHRMSWPIFGWMPTEIRKYREAEKIIRLKHHA